MFFHRRDRQKLILVALGIALGIPGSVFAQRGGTATGLSTPSTREYGMVRTTERISTVEVFLKGPDGQRLARAAVVTLIRANGQFFREGVTRGGHVRIEEVAPTEYNLRIVASGYSTVTKAIEVKSAADVKLTFQMEATAEGIDAISDEQMKLLGAKGQKELKKAIAEIRLKRPQEARAALQSIYKASPQSAEVQYLLGVTEQRDGHGDLAKHFWSKSLELEPKHYRTLVSMGETLLREGQSKEAMTYIERAAGAEPTTWRPHALYAEAYLKQGMNDEAIQKAKLAQELGHGKAAVVQPILAAALFKKGQHDQAITLVQEYLREHPTDAQAKNLLTAFLTASQSGAELANMVTVGDEAEEALPSGWMPRDIDEKVGTLEPGAVCSADEVLKKAGERVGEFLSNVERFTATETIQHESINKWGGAGSAIGRKFDYLVGVREIRPGSFSVIEYRNDGSGAVEFPDGIASSGLPAMILVFHPSNTPNFEIACEGLAHWSGGKAWQVHFRQRMDRPNTIRSYRFGLAGRVYPVNVKGRAWVAADTFQVVRMETQMIAPVKEINLIADYTAIEYGPVHFASRNEDMWLPQTAEVYAAWRGKRFHRSHSFTNYVLFSVDDKQKISDPKMQDVPATGRGSAGTEQNP